ncbi:hypothetical protein LQW54_005360 [Pestalotiopsis sp. IQ-011]
MGTLYRQTAKVYRWFCLVDAIVRGLHCRAQDRVTGSFVGKYFRIDKSGHEDEIPGTTITKEIRAGLITFATMAYIIAVNSSVLAETGGNCVCDDMIDHCRNDLVYAACKTDFKHDLIQSTALLAGFSSIAFGLFTNMPVALAPGMGVNAYFAYQVVGWHGTGNVSYSLALTAVFVEGLIFLLLSFLGMRQWLMKAIPTTIKVASGVGIGMFLTIVGLSYSVGIGAITGGKNTPLALAGCPPENLVDGVCATGIMTNPTMWLGFLLGGIFVAVMMAYRCKFAIVIGIALVTIVSWPRGTSITYFPSTPEGDERFDFFKQVVAFRPVNNLAFAHDWNITGAAGTHFCLALFTFLYVDIVDCTATLAAMARLSSTSDEAGNFPRSTAAYCTDATFISVGTFFGCAPVTAFIESAAGIMSGGRTGITAMSTGVCFLVASFFTPIFASIPPWATGSALILIGCTMISQIKEINWKYHGDAIPSFVTFVMMPLTYSVAYGLIAGMFTYVVLNTTIWLVLQVTRSPPEGYYEKEVHRWHIGEEDLPAWMRKLIDWFYELRYHLGYRRRQQQGLNNPKEGIEMAVRNNPYREGRGATNVSIVGIPADLRAQINRFI